MRGACKSNRAGLEGAVMVRKLLVAIAGLAVFALVGTASAAPITRTFMFEATNFGGAAPEPIVTGTLILTFDPMGAGSTDTPADAGSIVDLGALGTLSVANNIVFDYSNPGTTDNFTVGANGDADVLNAPHPDFFIQFAGISNPSAAVVFYTDAQGMQFGSETITITSVAEPATLAIFATALLMLGFFGRASPNLRRASGHLSPRPAAAPGRALETNPSGLFGKLGLHPRPGGSRSLGSGRCSGGARGADHAA